MAESGNVIREVIIVDGARICKLIQKFRDYVNYLPDQKDIIEEQYEYSLRIKEDTSDMRIITIVPADLSWPEEFEKIRVMISGFIGDLILGIEHVGSTSIPGLAAKPIIDLDVIIEDIDRLPVIIERLDKAGFDHEGNLGIEGREAFKRRFDDGYMKYHLYVCPKEAKPLKEHIAFRDYLRLHPDPALEYERIKRDLVRKNPHDIDHYVNGKTSFVEMIVKKALVLEKKDFILFE